MDSEDFEEPHLNSDADKLKRVLVLSGYGIEFERVAQDAFSAVAISSNVGDEFRKDPSHLIMAENSLLSLSSYPSCTDGITYAFVFKFEVNGENVIYARIFESGSYKGFMRKFGKDLIKEAISQDWNVDKVHFMDVYTSWDISAKLNHRMSSHTDSKRKRSRNSEMFQKLLFKNKHSFCVQFPIAYGKFKQAFEELCVGFVIMTDRTNPSSKSANGASYYKCEGLGDISKWKDQLSSFIISHVKSDDSIDFLLKEFGNADSLNTEEQFFVISCLPNYHHWLSQSSHGIKRNEYFQPHGKSPRNLVLQALDPRLEDVVDMDIVLSHVLQKSYSVGTTVPKRKRRRVCQRKDLQQTPLDNLLEAAGMSMDDYENLKTGDSVESSLYHRFRQQVAINGYFAWRCRSATEDIIVINDIDDENGSFQPDRYVQTKRMKDRAQTIWHCSCSLFRIINSYAEGVTCCHCRILEEMISMYDDGETERSSAVDHQYGPVAEDIQEGAFLKKIRDAVEHSKTRVLPVPCKDRKLRKYSVVSNDGDCEFVHVFVTNESDSNFISCQSGICQHQLGKKHKLRKLNDAVNICRHLATVKEHIEDVLKDFDTWQAQLDKNNDDLCDFDNPYDEDSEIDQADDVGNEEIGEGEDEIEFGLKGSEWEEIFNPVTGQWCFKSAYGYKVNSDADDERLKKNCHKRRRCFSGLETEKFYPDIESPNCDCDLPWPVNEDGNYKFVADCEAKIFTLHGIIPCYIYKLCCCNDTCVKVWIGENEDIFRYKTMCVGSEVGWYYIQLATTSKCNFSSFCNAMNFIYKHSDEKFMDVKSFRDWWFSWASHQQIDFRQQCFSCGSSPRILACDGTKIGPRATLVKLDPIERLPEASLPTNTKKLDRCFISSPRKDPDGAKRSREARVHLRYVLDSLQNKLGPNEILSPLEKELRDYSLMSALPTESHKIFRRLINHSLSESLANATTELFKYLSSESPLRSFIPISIVQKINEIYVAASEGQYVDLNSKLSKFKDIAPVFTTFVRYSFSEDCLSVDSDCMDLIIYLTKKVEEYSTTLADIVSSSPIDSSYNPPKFGRAYYFRPDGKQIRENRRFQIDDKEEAEPYSCRKRYPMVTNKASTFMFLWFCPLHGHCYGFHVINGSEGRKDPACSLFTHLEVPPDAIYYDFACGLEEYFLNRESGYVRNTQFYHDIFHSFNHRCCNCYRSQLIHGLEGVNSSICEQFNSFLQCIKSSARHMSQQRFMFYVQYMIHIWNEKKRASYERKLRTALQGTV